MFAYYSTRFAENTAERKASDKDKHEQRRDIWTDTTSCNEWDHRQSG